MCAFVFACVCVDAEMLYIISGLCRCIGVNLCWSLQYVCVMYEFRGYVSMFIVRCI